MHRRLRAANPGAPDPRENQGWEDYRSWLTTDRKMLARISKLIEDVRRDPFTGIGLA